MTSNSVCLGGTAISFLFLLPLGWGSNQDTICSIPILHIGCASPSHALQRHDLYSICPSRDPLSSTCLLHSVFLPTSTLHLCPCVKGLVSSASQLVPSHQRLQYSCGQHTQYICPPLPYSCSPDSMPTLEITQDLCTWDNLCVLFLFFGSQLSTQSHQTSFQQPWALLLAPISTSIFPHFLSSLGVCFLPQST